MMSKSKRIILVGLSYWPLIHVLLCALPFFLVQSWSEKILISLCILYFLPPLLARLTLSIFGRPPQLSAAWSKDFLVWWATSQFQVIYLRFSFLEEVLRIIPGIYNIWLRLWGAKVGRFIYWSPKVIIMDRSFLVVEDEAMIGYGAGFTSHHINKKPGGEIELLLASPIVRSKSIMGGLSGLGPGAELAAGEMLPSTMLVAPHYIWENGRRKARQPL